MARKKDLSTGIKRGADMFFSANDASEENQEHDAQQVHQEQEDHSKHVTHEDPIDHDDQKKRKVQEVPMEQIDEKILEMQAHIEAQEQRRTRGRKGFKMPRISTAYTPSNIDYLRIMAGLHGTSISGYVNDIIEQHREANAVRYQKAKELINEK